MSNVSQYIGARYVPLFVGDWNIDESYEPLCIVSYQGNSFTSKQFVPSGIEIDNETYWAPTGNFNAQLEAYRQEVQQLKTEVYENVSKFGAVGDGVTDDTQAIQDAIDSLDVINFDSDKTYLVSNILISSDNKVLNGNGCTIKGKDYATGVLTSDLQRGMTSFTVNNPEDFNVNQTAFIYNANSDPTGFQIVITGIHENTINFKAYKPFKTSDTTSDACPYVFPSGSIVYSGTTIFTIMRGMNATSSGTVKNILIRDFILEQSTGLTGVVGWGQLAYGLIAYQTENVKFINNYAKKIAALFLMFYGKNVNSRVEGNIFEKTTNSYAVCAHWDMNNISTDNRMHNFSVINNSFIDCCYGVIYSSVDSGICSQNRFLNSALTTNHLGINIYGGDVSLFKAYESYTQEDYYTTNVIVSENILVNHTKAGTAISVYGANNCKIIGNEIKHSNANITACAATNLDICNNTIEYVYVGTNSINSSIRTYGKVINLQVHDNVFNAPRVMLVDSLHRTISTGVLDDDYWGYSNSTVFIYDNTITQTDATSVIFINGTTETDTSPTVLMDVPSLIMFDNNRVINSAETDVTVFQLNATLQSFITDVTGLTSGQMRGYNNISYGLISAATAYRPYIPFTGNVEM